MYHVQNFRNRLVDSVAIKHLQCFINIIDATPEQAKNAKITLIVERWAIVSTQRRVNYEPLRYG
jgi:hypothetical protein